MNLVDQQLLEKSTKLELAGDRGFTPEMVQRSAELNSADRCFLELALNDAFTRRDIARIIGCDAGTVTRRLHALRRRLQNPLVIALHEKRLFLPEDYRQIGLDYFLRNRNTREIAQLRQVSRFQVLQLVHFLQSWFTGLCASPDLAARRLRRINFVCQAMLA